MEGSALQPHPNSMTDFSKTIHCRSKINSARTSDASHTSHDLHGVAFYAKNLHIKKMGALIIKITVARAVARTRDPVSRLQDGGGGGTRCYCPVPSAYGISPRPDVHEVPRNQILYSIAFSCSVWGMLGARRVGFNSFGQGVGHPSCVKTWSKQFTAQRAAPNIHRKRSVARAPQSRCCTAGEHRKRRPG